MNNPAQKQKSREFMWDCGRTYPWNSTTKAMNDSGASANLLETGTKVNFAT